RTALGSTTFTATSGNGRLPSGARTGCIGAAAGPASAPSARRRTAAGTRRLAGTTTSAAALPEFRSGPSRASQSECPRSPQQRPAPALPDRPPLSLSPSRYSYLRAAQTSPVRQLVVVPQLFLKRL